MSKINVIQLYSNISRAYEISKLGGHPIALCYPNPKLLKEKDREEEMIHPEDIQYVQKYFDIKDLLTKAEAAILMDFSKPPFPYPARTTETMDDIHERINVAKSFNLTSDTLPSKGLPLLKTAFERLNLSLKDLDIIESVSTTIARLDLSPEIRIEHLAEAIQYRSIIDSIRDETYLIYNINSFIPPLPI